MLVYITVMALMLAATINADVTIKRAITMEMAGMPASEITSTEQIQGSKSRESTEFTGGGAMAMMGGQQTTQVNITRLDKGVLWNVNDKAKAYHEIDLTSFKDVMDQSVKAKADKNKADKYEWTYDVKHEDKTTDHGFKCQAVIAVANGVNKDDPEDKAQLRYEFWMSDDLTGKSEMENYLKSFEEATGVDQYSQEEMIERMGSDFDVQLKKMAENFKDLKGFPVKTVLTIRKTGAPSIPGMPEGQQMDPEAMAMMQKMMGGKAPQAAEDGMTTVFSNTTEIVSVESGDLDGALFDIPEGYTKQ